MAKPKLSKRAVNNFRDRLSKIADRAISNWSRFQEWDQLERFLKINISPTFKALSYDYTNVNVWAAQLVRSAVALVEKQIEASQDNSIRLRVYPKSKCKTYGKMTALPEQQPVIDEVVKRLLLYHETKDPRYSTVLNDGRTGAGKTVIMGGVLYELINNHPEILEDVIPYAKFLILTPKRVVPSFREVLTDMGLGEHLDMLIHVMPYSQLSAKAGKALFVHEEEDPFAESEKDRIIYSFKPGMEPLFLGADECQTLGNPETIRTRIATSLLTSKRRPAAFFMSATPWDNILKAQTFVVSCGIKLAGIPVNPDNYRKLAGLFSEKPHKATEAGARRLRAVCAPYIVSIPRIKWPHTAYNMLRLCDFKSPEDEKLYRETEQRYIDRLRMLGRRPTANASFLRLTLLMQYAMSAEPLRIPQVTEWAYEDIKKGFSPVIGAVYKDSVIRAVSELADKGIPRSDMSIIWGGFKDFNKRRLLTPDQLADLSAKMLKYGELADEEYKKIQETVRYRTDAVAHGLVDAEGRILEAEQEKRIQHLKSLGLFHKPSDQEIEQAIHDFNHGKTKVCILTAASGGVGLSLDHRYTYTKPRVGYFPPMYSVVQFSQLLGRLCRRPTLTDTPQFVNLMKGTVEEHHIADILDKKLRFLAQTCRTATPLDFSESIANGIASDKGKTVNFPSTEEALQYAVEHSEELIVNETTEDE